MLEKPILKQLSSQSPEDAQRGPLTQLKTVRLNPSLSPEARACAFADALGNPYCYRCGEVTVKVEFVEPQVRLQQRLETFFLEKTSF